MPKKPDIKNQVINETIDLKEEDDTCPSDEGPVCQANEGFTNSIIKGQKWRQSKLNISRSIINLEEIKLVDGKLMKCVILTGDDFVKELKAGYIEVENQL